MLAKEAAIDQRVDFTKLRTKTKQSIGEAPTVLCGAKRSMALTAEEMVKLVELLVPAEWQQAVLERLQWLTTSPPYQYDNAAV